MINDLSKKKIDIDINNIPFCDLIDKPDKVPDFLNRFFVEIAEHTRGPDCNIDSLFDQDSYQEIYPGFELGPVDADRILSLVNDMDMYTSSCIDGINMKICKIFVEFFLTNGRSCSLIRFFCGIFPREWSCSKVTLLPKTGDLTNPGNLRPISQRCIFAKLLERGVHTELLEYLLDNKILTEPQYVFLPNRSTQEAV